MADNTTLNAGAGGDSVRDRDRAGVKTPVVGIDLTIGGASETLMNGSMPASQSGAWTVDTELTTADLDTGAGTDARAVVGLVYAASGGAILVSASNPLPVGGTVAISGTVPVSGTFWQATQPISGTVTANAGTNLNTSLLALESGGNLASLNTKTPALGQALAAASVPVVLTASQLTTLTPVSTVTANQGGTWTVQPGNTANTTAWLVTGTGGVFPATQSGAWNVGINSGSNLIGRAAATAETSAVYNGTTALTPKFAAISASASGDTTVIAAVASKKIRVLRWSLSASGNVNAKWKSSAAGDLTGLRYLTQYASAGGSYCPVGLFETTAGEGLVLNLSAAQAVGGELTYIEV